MKLSKILLFSCSNLFPVLKLICSSQDTKVTFPFILYVKILLMWNLLKPSHLSCRITHVLDFVDCRSLLSFNTFPCVVDLLLIDLGAWSDFFFSFLANFFFSFSCGAGYFSLSHSIRHIIKIDQCVQVLSSSSIHTKFLISFSINGFSSNWWTLSSSPFIRNYEMVIF